MKKKILIGIATGVIAAAMCAGFAACGGANAKSVKGEKVTEEQWQKALVALWDEKAEFTVETYSKETEKATIESMVHNTKYSVTTTESFTYTKKGALESKLGSSKTSYGGDKEYAESKNGKALEKEVELYYQSTADTNYLYEKGLDGEWSKKSTYSSLISSVEGFSQLTSLGGSYSSFVYSPDHNGYVPKSYQKGEDDVTVIKFRDGKLVAVYIYEKEIDIQDAGVLYGKSVKTSETHITFTYSAKDITLPTVAA